MFIQICICTYTYIESLTSHSHPCQKQFLTRTQLSTNARHEHTKPNTLFNMGKCKTLYKHTCKDPCFVTACLPKFPSSHTRVHQHFTSDYTHALRHMHMCTYAPYTHPHKNVQCTHANQYEWTHTCTGARQKHAQTQRYTHVDMCKNTCTHMHTHAKYRYTQRHRNRSMHTLTHTEMHAHIHTKNMCTHSHTESHKHRCTNTCTHIHRRTLTHHTHAGTHIPHDSTCMHTNTSTQAHTCTDTHARANIHRRKHTCTQTHTQPNTQSHKKCTTHALTQAGPHRRTRTIGSVTHTCTRMYVHTHP